MCIRDRYQRRVHGNLQRVLGAPVEIITQLHELGGLYNKDQQALKGNTREWFEERYPDFLVPDEITHDGWFHQAQRESADLARVRARDLLERIKRIAMSYQPAFVDIEKPDGHDYIAFVCHGAFMNIKMSILFDCNEKSKTKFVMENTGLTCFELDSEARYQLKFFNLAEHLYEDTEEDLRGSLDLQRKNIELETTTTKDQCSSPLESESPKISLDSCSTMMSISEKLSIGSDSSIQRGIEDILQYKRGEEI
eukprot:TRINITY_DN8945_c0_g1_i10.p1 TRINITY_DN8945_c0_g1~~TRINITY_DN8945_c0_g1_i10.p1  ORF type:complete len:252 (-),score=55.42 TRINITY_DN8945_c0_g1_i10:612-1367(-)